ncbi:MAG: hypothetical protein ACRD3J_16800 [Thermoanaerobaculia bacterium]
MGTAVNVFADRRIVERIRAEFLEMPDMQLKIEQVQRPCGIDAATCHAIMDALVKTQVVSLKPDGRYVRGPEGHSSVRQPVKAELKPMRFAPPSRRAS